MNFMVLHWIMKSIESDLNPRLVSLFKTEHRISGAGFRGARSAGFKYNYRRRIAISKIISKYFYLFWRFCDTLMTELAVRILVLRNLALPAIFSYV